MPRKREGGFRRWFERFSNEATRWTGSRWAFGIAAGTVLVWMAAGPLFDFSNRWQLVINTVTTIVTFLMVFLIQHTQNKDTKAMELKLNELVAAIEGASNRLIDVESLSEEDLETLHRHYQHLCSMAKKEESLTRSHSVEEAEARHRGKRKSRASPS